MFELIRTAAHTGYIQSPAKIGFFELGGGEVCLIDSGNDKDAGRKLRQLLETNGWHLQAIFNTHSHADHIGGNRYLQSQTGCRIFAPGIERDFTCHTELEPALLYGGYPGRDLRHKFLMAQESNAEMLTEGVLPDGLELLPLPGHCLDMVGYRTADHVVFLADCLSSRETLDKYQIGFLYDVAAYLNTLEKVKAMEAALFIPSHAEPTENIAPLAQYNIDKVLEIGDTIVRFCAEPITFETLLQKLFTHYMMTMNFEQYVLIGSTVRSYLSWLKDAGRLSVRFEEQRMLWEKA